MTVDAPKVTAEPESAQATNGTASDQAQKVLGTDHDTSTTDDAKDQAKQEENDTTTETTTPPQKPLEITNYDVLADEVETPMTDEEHDTGLSLAAHSYHVGNNRLEVLCNMHCQGFADHQANGYDEGSASIVEKIRLIVKNQCIPKGRFLQRNSQGEWTEMDDDKERLLIRSTLGQITGIKNSSTTNNNNNANNIASTSNITTTTRNNIGRPQQGFQMSRMMLGMSQRRLSKEPTKVDAEQLKKQQEADAEKKRRRRSSLLRRSVSSSMLPTMRANLFDKKKSTRTGFHEEDDDDDDEDDDVLTLTPDQTPAHSRSNSPLPPSSPMPPPMFGRSNTVAVSSRRPISPLAPTHTPPRELVKGPPHKMDVVLNPSMTDLIADADCYGNNRLRVMLSIQSPPYQSGTPQVQHKIVTDLLATIHNFWGGRLLAQGGLAVGVDSYIPLNEVEQINAMKGLLSGKPPEMEQPVQRGRRASLKAIQSLAEGSGAAGGGGVIMPSTLPSLPAELQQLRSAAVKSLQKRKQKQSLNNRITRLTADKAAAFQDGQASAVMLRGSSPTREASPPPPPHGAFAHYRQTSSGASVASTVTHMSTGTQATGGTYSPVNPRPVVHPQYNMGMQLNSNVPGAIIATLNDNMPSVPEGHLTGRAAAQQQHLHVLNSTGSDGLPHFGDGEMELLAKALEDS